LDLIITDGDMNKTPDLRAFRSFVAVGDIDGVTAAAGKLNLT
jgi:hypothetical protein